MSKKDQNMARGGKWNTGAPIQLRIVKPAKPIPHNGTATPGTYALAALPEMKNMLAAIGSQAPQKGFAVEARHALENYVPGCGPLSGYAPVGRLELIAQKFYVGIGEIISLVMPDEGDVAFANSRGEIMKGAEDFAWVRTLRKMYEKQNPKAGLTEVMMHGKWVAVRDRLLKTDPSFLGFYEKNCFFKPMAWVEITPELGAIIQSEGSVLAGLDFLRRYNRLELNGCYYANSERASIQAYRGVPYAASASGDLVPAPTTTSNLAFQHVGRKAWGIPFEKAMQIRGETKLREEVLHQLHRTASLDKPSSEGKQKH